MCDGGKPIAEYSDAEIRDALIACGQSDVPAVTPLTRPTLQRKLENLRAGSPAVQQQQPVCGNPSATEPAHVATGAADRAESAGDNQDDKPEGYYGVAAAPNEQSMVPLSPYYTSKKDVLLAIKGSKLKGARFKRFESPQSAEAYSRQRCSLEAEASSNNNAGDAERADPSRVTPETAVKTEKANNYPSLKQQDHTALRQLIEAGDVTAFAKCVWENPRHLVTAGDTPEILQPGNRYNALHCAVRKGQLQVCKELFAIIESDSFWKLLYPDDTEQVRQDRKSRLIDLYLNVPDKTGETALHLACKHGMEGIVSYLVTYPQLNVMARNAQGLIPSEAVQSSSSPALKKRIITALQEPEVFYVPVLRTMDNSSPASVGPPSRLTDPLVGTPPRSLDGSALRVDAGDVISQAFAGPMSPSKATQFYREWKSPSCEKEKHINARRTDSERGLERVGRHIAHQEGVEWSEYWDFLGCYTDLSKDEGISRLEGYLTTLFSQVASPHTGGAVEGGGSNNDRSLTSSVQQRPLSSSSTSSVASAYSRAIPCKLFAEESKDVALAIDASKENPISDSMILTSPLPPSSPQPSLLQSSRVAEPCDGKFTASRNVSSLTDVLSGLHLSVSGDKEDADGEEKGGGDGEEVGGGDGEEEEKRTSGEPSGLPAASQHTPPACINAEAIGLPVECLPSGTPSLDSVSSPSSASHPGFSHTPVFLAGSRPTKLDCDVKLALCNVEVDASRYPHVSQWLTQVRSYTEQEQKSWPTPVSKPGGSRPNMGLPLSPLVFSSPLPSLMSQSPPLSRRTPHTPRVPRTPPVHHLSRSSLLPRLLV